MPAATDDHLDPSRSSPVTAAASADRERLLLGGVVFAVLFAQVSLYPGIDRLVTALGAAAVLGASTWFLGVELAASVAFVWVWGVVSDVRGVRVPLIRVGALAAAASYAVLALVPQAVTVPFAGALVVRALQGAATVGVLSLAMTMLMDLPGGHGRNMGAAGVAVGTGTALGAPVGGLLYGWGPFVPLAAASVLTLVVAVLTTGLADRTPTVDRRGGLAAVVGRVRTTPGLAVPYAFGFIDRLSAGVFALAGTLYFRTEFGLSPAATGAMLALFFAPFALFQYPFGALSDRVGRTVPVVVGSVGYGLGVAAVGLAPTVVVAGAAMAAVGVIGAFMSPATMALVTDLAGADERGVAMAGFNATASVGFLVGVVLGGTVAEAAGFASVFLLAGAVEVALAVVAGPAVVRLVSTAPGDASTDDATRL
jgi:MFS family permease